MREGLYRGEGRERESEGGSKLDKGSRARTLSAWKNQKGKK